MRSWTKVVAAGLLCGLTLAPVAWGAPDARVNVNAASAAELAKLPGIGPSKAQAIVEHRTREPFVTAEDLRKVKGIGDKLYDSIKDQVTVGDAPSPTGRGS